MMGGPHVPPDAAFAYDDATHALLVREARPLVPLEVLGAVVAGASMLLAVSQLVAPVPGRDLLWTAGGGFVFGLAGMLHPLVFRRRAKPPWHVNVGFGASDLSITADGSLRRVAYRRIRAIRDVGDVLVLTFRDPTLEPPIALVKAAIPDAGETVSFLQERSGAPIRVSKPAVTVRA